MKNGHALESNRLLAYFDGRTQTAFDAKIVSRGEEMRGVQAGTDVQRSKSVDNFAKFLEPRAQRRAHSRGILHEDAHGGGGKSFRGLLDRFHYGGDGLAWPRFASRSRVNNDEIRAQRQATQQFVVKGLNRSSAQHGLRGRQVD